MTITDSQPQPNPDVETPPAPFNIGDVVTMKGCFEPHMTVEGLFTHPSDPGAWVIATAWFDHQLQLQHAQFQPAALKAVP